MLSYLSRQKGTVIFVRTSDRSLAYSRLVGGRAPLFFADAGVSGCANGLRHRERLRVFCADFGAAAWRIRVLPAEGRRVFCAEFGIRRRAFVRAIRTVRRIYAAAPWFAGERQQAELAATKRRAAVPRHLRPPEARAAKKEKL